MLLAFEVVLFGGLAFMFFCILRNQDAMLDVVRKEHAETLALLEKMEKRLAALQQLEASIAINPLVRQAYMEARGVPCPPDEKNAGATAVRQTPPPVQDAGKDAPLGQDSVPARDSAEPFGGLSMEPPSASGCPENERHRGGMPELKL